ncbi:MAG: hypothetical protein QHJ81_14780 [Anaerolineae bacterium]|nr:hypothetical protein [Anaerolineae bacterium]
MSKQLLSRDVQEAARQLLPYFFSKFGQGVLTGDLLPDSMGARNLGGERRYFDTIYAMNVKANLVEAARVLMGVGVNLVRNGSFEQAPFDNQPVGWVMYTETRLGEPIP